MKTSIINRRAGFLALCFALSLALGCNCDKTKLINTWVLEKYGPEAALKTVATTTAKPEILLNLDKDKKFTGNDGCNAIFGTYDASGGGCKIQFGSINSTLMFCTDAGIMDQAAAIATLLRNTSSFEISDTHLKLCTPGKEVLQYRKK